MFDSVQLTTFLLASLAMVAIPGPAVLFIVAHSTVYGRRSGIKTVAGIAVGNFAHAVLAAIGVSAVLKSSPLAYETLKYAGAAYLIFLGVRKLASRVEITDDPLRATRESEQKSVFFQGMLVGMLNPKVALFFISFLPQFADTTRDHVELQLFVLGVIFVVVGWVGDTAYALISGTLGTRFLRSSESANAGRIGSGVLYCVLGLSAALLG